MNVTQSAITSGIKELELELKVPLFLRSSKGMELSEKGREFLQSAYDIVERVEQAKNISKRSTTLSGRVNLAVTYTVAGYFLPKHLKILHNLYPNITITIHESTRKAIEEGISSFQYDFGLVLTSNIENKNLKTETLIRSPRRLWAAVGHKFCDEQTIDFKKISKEPYIMLKVDESAHTTMRYWNKTGYNPYVYLSTSSIEAVRSMVANGEGVTILSDMVYRPWSLEGRRIIRISTNPEAPTMNVGLAWRSFDTPSPSAQLIMDYFRNLSL